MVIQRRIHWFGTWEILIFEFMNPISLSEKPQTQKPQEEEQAEASPGEEGAGRAATAEEEGGQWQREGEGER